jgi:hypothetical protein
VTATGREAGDRHRLDERERIAFDEDAVLERSGLRLVGVAHQMVWSRRLAGDGVPLASGRERRAAAPDEPGVGDLADDLGGADGECPSECLVAAGGPIVVEAGRVDPANTT